MCSGSVKGASRNATIVARCIVEKGGVAIADAEYVMDSAGIPKISFEANGPTHYDRNIGHVAGSTLLRERLLRKLGCVLPTNVAVLAEVLLGHPENYLFLLSKDSFLGSRYPKVNK